MSTEPWNDPDVREWLEDARANLIPMIRDSDASVSLVPDTADDVKYAVELGLSIMLDKPIIAVVLDGRPVPKKMFAVADAVLHLTAEQMRNGVGRQKIGEVLEELLGPEIDDD